MEDLLLVGLLPPTIFIELEITPPLFRLVKLLLLRELGIELKLFILRYIKK